MGNDTLPSATQLRKRFAICGVAATLATLAILSLYVGLLTDLAAADWSSLAVAMLPVGVLASCANALWLQRAVQPVAEWLEALGRDAPERGQTRRAFAAVIALPSRTQRSFSIAWIGAAIGAPALLTLNGEAGWGIGIRSFVVLAGGVTAALVSAFALYFAVKRDLEPIACELATRIEDPDERRKQIQHVSVSRKISRALVATVAATLIFAMTLAHTHSEAALDDMVWQWQARALDAFVDEFDGSNLDAASRAVAGRRDGLPFPVHFELIDPRLVGADSGEWWQTQREIVAAVERGASSGTLSKSALWVFRSLADGRIATARTPRSDLYARSSWSTLAILCTALIASLGCAFMVASLIATDLRRSFGRLRDSAERMAGGDLRRAQIYESEDEFAELSRCFEVMGSAVRSSVERLSQAADGVDLTAGEMASVAQGVAAVSAGQLQRVRQASQLMVAINNQVMEVSGSAQDLNISIEESSSSILELGATGHELNETASVLGTKVEEISSSIEQMVRSVKQVGTTSDGLSDAAAETSASMEDMAAAMRAVDTTAELTASLSRDVVESAESGREKVSQTIGGMQAIQDATNSAENVICGLGARTQEIGAILDVIEDVAEETNLLALNAAIIAAQAGEHGRAFSVVADEIKELADRVLASTKEIGSLIRAVQDESDNAVGAIEAGSRSVASGVELSAAAGVSLEEITSSSRESGQRIAEIVSAVREQTRAASHVVALMDTVRDGVTAIAGAATDQDRGNEVVYRSSITMREVSQQVRRTTEEQSRGFGRIRESIEGVREIVENINGSLQEQSTACSQVAEFLEQVFERSRSNENSAKSMGDSIRGLVSQAEDLREQAAKFRI